MRKFILWSPNSLGDIGNNDMQEGKGEGAK